MKVLLAATVENVAEIQFPVIGSPKLDGIRAWTGPIGMMSRSAKLIPNAYIQDKLKPFRDLKLDGELIVGSPTHPLCYTVSSSGIMSRGGTPDFTYHVFDIFTNMNWTFEGRYGLLEKMIQGFDRVRLVPHVWLWDRDDLMSYENEQVALGYEGIMLRSPEGIYKQGRSTMKEQYLMKVKRFRDTEAEVVGFKERFHNANEATTNSLGYTERSGHKENLVPMDTLGALVLKHPEFAETFDCGSGFTDEQRREAWAGRFDCLIGRTAIIKYQEAGVKDKPRFPIFKGWRYPE